jgi:hypothetical protein
MALLNYSLPFGAINTPPAWATISPSIHASPHAVNNLYEPSGHRQENVLHNNDNYYKSGPYRHHIPQSQQQQQQQQQQQPQQTQNSRNYLPPPQTSNNRNGYAQQSRTRTYGESSYSQQPPTSYSSLSHSTGYYNNAQQQQPQQKQQQQSFKENPFQVQQKVQTTTKAPLTRPTVSYQTNSNKNYQNQNLNNGGYPQQPPGFKPIQAGQGSRTQNGK